MQLHELTPPAGSKRDRKRLGRGTGSGLGKTAGRGHKGYGSRSGSGKKPGFEGGQMPLQRRLPKFGFTNIFRVEVQIVNVCDLVRCEPGEITVETLVKVGLVKNSKAPVKILGNGTIDKAYTVKATAFSKSAVQKIEAAGGKTEVVK